MKKYVLSNPFFAIFYGTGCAPNHITFCSTTLLNAWTRKTQKIKWPLENWIFYVSNSRNTAFGLDTCSNSGQFGHVLKIQFLVADTKKKRVNDLKLTHRSSCFLSVTNKIFSVTISYVVACFHWGEMPVGLCVAIVDTRSLFALSGQLYRNAERQTVYKILDPLSKHWSLYWVTYTFGRICKLRWNWNNRRIVQRKRDTILFALIECLH